MYSIWWHFFLHACLSTVAFNSFSSHDLRCWASIFLHLQGYTSSWWRYRVPAYCSCIHLYITVWGNQWFSSQMPVYHKECLLGYSYPSCDECVLAIIMSANMLGRPAWDRASALDTLSCQNVTNVSQVKDVVFSLIWHRWSMILSHSAVWEWCRHCGLSWS